MPGILSSHRQLNGLWMRFAISVILYIVSACDIKKNSFNASSKWLYLSCSCGGQPAGERWQQLLSVALSVSYDNQDEKLVSLQSARNAKQELSSWTVQVTNSEFSGTAVTAQMDVFIDVASRMGLMTFRCNFVAIDTDNKYKYRIKPLEFQAPGSKTTVTFQSFPTKGFVGDITTASPSTTITSTATRTSFNPMILTRLRSLMTTAYQETSTAKATSLTSSTNEATSTTTVKSTSRETRRSSTDLQAADERTGASEALNGVSNHLSLAVAFATLAVLAAGIIVPFVWLIARWCTKPVADPPPPQPHRLAPTGALSQELLNKLSDFLSSGTRPPFDALEKRDSHVYETPYDVSNDEDFGHPDGTLNTENNSDNHTSPYVSESVKCCDETLHTVSSRHPLAGAALYLTAVSMDKRHGDLSADVLSSYVTPVPV